MGTLKIIEPSSKLEKKKFEKGVERLNKLNLNFEIPKGKESYFFASKSTIERFYELKEGLLDEKIEYILPTRGGAGAIHLLPLLKNLKIKEKKILIGSSDFTYLGLFLLEKYNFPFCHGPMLSDLGRGDFSKLEENFFKKIIEKENFLYKNLKGIKFLKKGKTEGVLYGGNLTLFVSMLSFYKFSSFKDKILFLEDVNEPLYKVDRNLFLLKLKGILNEIKGLIFGKMQNCFKESSKEDFINLLKDYFKEKEYPVILFFPSGHSKPNLPLWIGGKIFIDTKNKIIESRFTYGN